jgi:hypothetical protein
MALSAAPAGATLANCQPGHQGDPKYCENVPPTAITDDATNIGSTSATLNGHAGSTVAGGDPTTFHFDYGTTTAYGQSTPPQTLGSCPPGVTPHPPASYCTTPASQAVSANVAGLTPCTTYHFRIVASNPDGTVNGADKMFTTGSQKPIAHVKKPKKVRANHKFRVKITLRSTAHVTILIKSKKGKIVRRKDAGVHGPGTFTVKMRAPRHPGKYTLVVKADSTCGTQRVKKKLHVIGHGKHHKHHKHHKH